MTWDMVNSLGRILLTIVVVVKITRFGETLNKVERLGLGLMGSGSLLTIDVIWNMQASPFLDWSTALITYGALMFIAGRTWRDWGHEWRNRRQVAQAREILTAKGKL